MDLDLTYDEALDFIIYLDEGNLSHASNDAHKRKAREFLTDFIKSLSFEADETGCYSYTQNDDGSVSIGVFFRYEDLKYSSARMRAFMKNRSLIDRLKVYVPENSSKDTAFFKEIGQRGGKARTKNKVLEKFIEDFAKSNQSTTFEKAWSIWKKQKTYVFENAEINFTDTAVETDGKTLKKSSVSRYFYDAKKVLQ